MKTTMPTHQQQMDKKWFVVDAEGAIMGRLATKVADVLRGKHKPIFTPHLDMGDHVVIINVAKIKVTGAKKDQKYYYSHSGVPGNLKMVSLKQMLQKKPLKAFENAVKGMLPKNKLRDKFMKKLHLYEGAEHNNEAQKPVELKL